MIFLFYLGIFQFNPISYGGGGGFHPPSRKSRITPGSGALMVPIFFWQLVVAKFATFGKKKIGKKWGVPPSGPPKKGSPQKMTPRDCLWPPIFFPEIVRYILGGMFAKN